MPFVKGFSGNPSGRPKTKVFADALRIAVLESIGDKTKLRVIAEKLTDQALSGEIQAIKEIADRLDGRSVASIEQSIVRVDAREYSDSDLVEIIAQSIKPTLLPALEDGDKTVN